MLQVLKTKLLIQEISQTPTDYTEIENLAGLSVSIQSILW